MDSKGLQKGIETRMDTKIAKDSMQTKTQVAKNTHTKSIGNLPYKSAQNNTKSSLYNSKEADTSKILTTQNHTTKKVVSESMQDSHNIGIKNAGAQDLC